MYDVISNLYSALFSRSCINHQMFIKKECFFCKAAIVEIENIVKEDL